MKRLLQLADVSFAGKIDQRVTGADDVLYGVAVFQPHVRNSDSRSGMGRILRGVPIGIVVVFRRYDGRAVVAVAQLDPDHFVNPAVMQIGRPSDLGAQFRTGGQILRHLGPAIDRATCPFRPPPNRTP